MEFIAKVGADVYLSSPNEVSIAASRNAFRIVTGALNHFQILGYIEIDFITLGFLAELCAQKPSNADIIRG
jgi:hypothetical protein